MKRLYEAARKEALEETNEEEKKMKESSLKKLEAVRLRRRDLLSAGRETSECQPVSERERRAGSVHTPEERARDSSEAPV